MGELAMLTSTAFWRRSRGSERRIAALAEALAGRGLTVVWAGRLGAGDRAAVGAMGLGLEETGVALPTPGPNAPLDAFTSPEFDAALADALGRVRPGVLIAQYIRFAPAIAALPDRLRPGLTVVDTHDVMHTRGRAFRDAGHDHWIDLTRDDEARALGVFDRVLAINDADARELAAMTGADRVLVVPHAVALAPERAEPVGPARALFVGAGGVPNLDAARRLADGIWPAARARLPEGATLVIAGAAAEALDAAAREPAGIACPGFVPDLDALYATAHAAVAPLRFGGGLKIKNVEALAHGVPLVTTPAGAQGLEAGAGSAFLVGDTDAELADALVRVLTDGALRQSLRAEGRRFARERFAPEAAYAPLLGLLGAVRGAAA